MIRKVILPVIVLLLLVVIFINETFKEVAAGVAILLFGMMMLEEGFNTFVEGPVQKFIHKVSNTLPKGMGLGFIFTTLLQSSSLISVITISFLSAGLLGLRSGIGIIFGANLGSTTTAWLVSMFGLDVNISALSMPMLILGVIFISQKSKKTKRLWKHPDGSWLFFSGHLFYESRF